MSAMGAPQGARYALVVAGFYAELAERLVAGARRAFTEAGVGDELIDEFDVPGSFELPLAAKSCAGSGRYAGVVCLGAVIRGETDHYDYVCAAVAEGVLRAALDTGVPCSFGVLTCETMDQALERAGGGKRDTGYDAARTAMHMAGVASGFKEP